MTEQENTRLAEFKKIFEEMTPINDKSYKSEQSNIFQSAKPVTQYTIEEAANIIASGNSSQLKTLSLTYSYKSPIYHRLIYHYATALYYRYLIVPYFSESTTKVKKETELYHQAVHYYEQLRDTIFIDWSMAVLTEGEIYGMLCGNIETGITYMRLPDGRCRSRFASYNGLDRVELDLRYFSDINDPDDRAAAFRNYPKEVEKAYRRYEKGKAPYWYLLPEGIAFHFSIYDDRPFFSSLIPSLMDLDEYKAIDKNLCLQELDKILVQKSPHLNDGNLVFEPQETRVAHDGTKKMLKNVTNVDILTTYFDVDLLKLRESNSATADNVERKRKMVYAESGTSEELFNAQGNTALKSSIINDTQVTRYLAEKYAVWLSFVLNNIYSKGNFTLKAILIPSGPYNDIDLTNEYLKMAEYGYSFLVPAVAMGQKQGAFLNTKKLENGILKLSDIMRPLQSAHTQSSKNAEQTNTKSDDNKSDKTIQNIESGGGAVE